jgi:hypothetical protein
MEYAIVNREILDLESIVALTRNMVAGLTLEVNIERQTKRRTKLIAAPESFPVYPKLELIGRFLTWKVLLL